MTEPDQIISTIAAKHGLSPRDVGGHDARTPKVIRARQEAMWALRQAGWSSVQVGYLLASDDRDPFDHATVLRGAARHASRLRDIAERAGA